MTQFNDLVLSFILIRQVIHYKLLLFTDQIDVNTVAFGNAYTLTRDMYNRIGFIYDECIASNCDNTYAFASFPEDVEWGNWSSAHIYHRHFDSWIKTTKQVFKGKRSYVHGQLIHFYHGGKFPYFGLQRAVEK